MFFKTKEKKTSDRIVAIPLFALWRIGPPILLLDPTWLQVGGGTSPKVGPSSASTGQAMDGWMGREILNLSTKCKCVVAKENEDL